MQKLKILNSKEKKNLSKKISEQFNCKFKFNYEVFMNPKNKIFILNKDVSKINLEPRESEQYFALNFEGYIEIPNDGLYTFYLISNDGSKMFLNGMELINSDGLHPALERFTTVALSAGKHAVEFKYFQGGGSNFLKLMWEGPGFEKQEVPDLVLFH